MEELSELTINDKNQMSNRNASAFFTAEIESLIETFSSNHSDVKVLPKIEMVDANNTLFSQQVFEKKLSDVLKKPLKNSNKKYLILLDCGFLNYNSESNAADNNLYAQTTIVDSISRSRDFSELGLLCFTKDSLGNIKYYFVGRKNLIAKKWLDNTFFQAANTHNNSKIESLVLKSSENYVYAGVEICYQAKQFIDKGIFEEDQKLAHRSFELLANTFEDELSKSFYNARSFSHTLKSNLAYFLAMLSGYLIFAGSRYAETWMVMSKDETLLETSTLPVAIMRVMVLLSVRPLESITMLGATAFGAKRYSEIGSLLRAGWVASLILNAFAIPILCTSEYWLRSVFRQDPSLAKAAGDYLKMYAWAIPPMTATVADHNIFFATNNPGVVALIELTTILMGVGFTYTFVLGKFGFQAQGLTGFATSLVLQKWLNFLLAKGYLFATKDSRKYSVFSHSSYAEIMQKVKLIFRKGLPLTLQIGSEQLYLFIVAIYAGLYGRMYDTKSLDQANILNEYFTLFSISGALVIHKTLMQRVGEVSGRDLMLRDKHASLELIQQNLSNVMQILKVNGLISAVYTAAVGGLFIFGCQSLVSVYINSNNFTEVDRAEIKNNICPLFLLLVGCTFTEMAGNVMNGALNGLGDVDSPMLRSLFLTVAVGGALGAVLCFALDLGLEGVFTSSLIAYFIGVLTLTKTLHSTYKNLKENTTTVNESVLGKAWNTLINMCTFFNRTSVIQPVKPVEISHSTNGRSSWNMFSGCCLSFFHRPRESASDQVELLADTEEFRELVP